jgi:hypothetical protein
MSGPWIVAFILLGGLLGLLCVLFLALARYVAALASRLPDPVPLELAQGPPTGSRLEDVPLPRGFVDIVAGPNGSAGPAAASRLALVFLSTSCTACRTMIGGLNRFARDWSELRVVSVVSGRGEEAERMARALSSPESVVDGDATLARAFGVATVPFAFLYDHGELRAKGVVNDREMLESLVAGRTRKEGDELLESFATLQGD